MSGSFLSAWLGDEPRARAFLGPGVRAREVRATEVARAAGRRISPAFAAALRETDDGLPASAARTAHLHALSAGGVAAIVTGQQAGLFLGPLLTIYKAASAIVLARALTEETGVRCVPVFWLQDEDHDFLEINHVWIPGAIQPERIALPDDDRRPSVAHRVLGEEIQPVHEALAAALGALPFAGDVLGAVTEAYRPGRTVAAAFAHLLSTFFAEEGLVIVDPRNPATAAAISPILQRAVREHLPIGEALQLREQALAEAGFSAQVPLRLGSPLAFYHLDAIDGPRHRLALHADGRLHVLGGDRAFPFAEVAEAPPLRLSSSALLRPVVQDTLLPTAAYVGGPAELAYFAQLAPLYRHFGLDQPAFALRARLRFVDAGTRSLLERAGVEPAQVEAPRDALLARLVRSDLTDPATLRAELLAPFGARLAALEAQELDENLKKPIARTRETVEHAVGRLVDRYTHVRLEKDQVVAGRVDRLRAALYPHDTPQERVFGYHRFAAACGLRAFKAAILGAIDPFDPGVRDVRA